MSKSGTLICRSLQAILVILAVKMYENVISTTLAPPVAPMKGTVASVAMFVFRGQPSLLLGPIFKRTDQARQFSRHAQDASVVICQVALFEKNRGPHFIP